MEQEKLKELRISKLGILKDLSECDESEKTVIDRAFEDLYQDKGGVPYGMVSHVLPNPDAPIEPSPEREFRGGIKPVKYVHGEYIELPESLNVPCR